MRSIALDGAFERAEPRFDDGGPASLSAATERLLDAEERRVDEAARLRSAAEREPGWRVEAGAPPTLLMFNEVP